MPLGGMSGQEIIFEDTRVTDCLLDNRKRGSHAAAPILNDAHDSFLAIKFKRESSLK